MARAVAHCIDCCVFRVCAQALGFRLESLGAVFRVTALWCNVGHLYDLALSCGHRQGSGLGEASVLASHMPEIMGMATTLVVGIISVMTSASALALGPSHPAQP